MKQPLIFSILVPIKNLYKQCFPEYQMEEKRLSLSDNCYCGSKQPYYKCHYPANKEKMKYAVRRIKRYTLSGKEKEKIILKNDIDAIRKKTLKKGMLNKLNKKGEYIDTSQYYL